MIINDIQRLLADAEISEHGSKYFVIADGTSGNGAKMVEALAEVLCQKVGGDVGVGCVLLESCYDAIDALKGLGE